MLKHTEIFAVCPPGLEDLASAEAVQHGFTVTGTVPGGVMIQGGWPEVWRANLRLRGAVRILLRVAEFRAMHVAQLDKRARRVDWAALLPSGAALRVDATCRQSRIYHAGAAASRVAGAVEAAGLRVTDDAPLRLLVRIDDDLCTISLDTTGAPLHQRGHKPQVGKAPIRETLAALFLRACDYTGDAPLIDPMCGSGTIPIEAAEIAAGLAPGRSRDFAFMDLPSFDPRAWQALQGAPAPAPLPPIYGYDRDQGAITRANANSTSAGFDGKINWACQPISALSPPDTPPGLILANPPYGARIGNKKALYALYGSFGTILKQRFSGWRVGIITSDASLAKTTGLPFDPPGPIVPNGGIKIRLWQALL
jgi:putative N6-adenine-specific DNA methylase